MTEKTGNVAFRDVNLTPRTDAQERALGLAWFGLTDFLGRAQDESAKYRELARQLERELRDLMEASAPPLHPITKDDPEVALKAAHAEIERLCKRLSEAQSHIRLKNESTDVRVLVLERDLANASAYAVLAHEALLIARRVLVRWEELYAEWSNANGHMALLFDRRLPPADHVKALEAIYAALAKNPNPSGQTLSAEASFLQGEASGPVGLGPAKAEYEIFPNIREWCRGSPSSIVITFAGELTNAQIDALPKALMRAVHSSSAAPNDRT